MKKLIVGLAIALALTVVIGHPLLAKKQEAGTTMTVSSDPGAGGGTTA